LTSINAAPYEEPLLNGWSRFRLAAERYHALLERISTKRDHPSGVMPALVAGIHVFLAGAQQERRGWPGKPGHDSMEKWLNRPEFALD
jgi:hypothetical protein